MFKPIVCNQGTSSILYIVILIKYKRWTFDLNTLGFSQNDMSGLAMFWQLTNNLMEFSPVLVFCVNMLFFSKYSLLNMDLCCSFFFFFYPFRVFLEKWGTILVLYVPFNWSSSENAITNKALWYLFLLEHIFFIFSPLRTNTVIFLKWKYYSMIFPSFGSFVIKELLLHS